MARRCQLTGAGPVSGNNVSHSNRRTKRRFQVNVQSRRYWVPGEGRWVTLRLSARAIKTIDKIGIEKALVTIRARGERV
ncbi:MAG: 50S ribosomal protein L28 [Thermoleophilia bacterium]